MTKSIAVIGGGIVGATAAYYLARAGNQVTVYDEGTGQATSAAAGIICPWLSQRRNKKWYRLAANGAGFYQQLLEDLAEDGETPQFYHRSGAILLKKKPEYIQEQYERGLQRRESAPEIGELRILDREELQQILPTLKAQEHALYVGGGARVQGGLMVETLLASVAERGGQIVREQALLVQKDNWHLVKTAEGEYAYDRIILAGGAWLPQILSPLGWQVDIRGQKGQLAVLQTDDHDNGQLPVIMPEGEIDVLPVGNGKVFVGASHENDKGYDLAPDPDVIERLMTGGRELFGRLNTATLLEVRVGTRAYTSDFSPFFGYLPGSEQVLVASGLGSSGLTTGPYIGYELAKIANGQEPDVPLEDYLPDNYLQKKITF